MTAKERRSHIISIISVSLFLIIMTVFVYLPKQEMLLSSLAFLQNQQRFYIEDLSSGILLNDATPVSDEKGLQYTPYRFKVVNTSNSAIKYNVVFKNNEEKAKAKGLEVLPNKYLRYSLKEGYNQALEPQTLQDDGILYTTTIPSNSTVVFEFKMWLDWNADNGAMNKIFIGKIELEEVEK